MQLFSLLDDDYFCYLLKLNKQPQNEWHWDTVHVILTGSVGQKSGYIWNGLSLQGHLGPQLGESQRLGAS